MKEKKGSAEKDKAVLYNSSLASRPQLQWNQLRGYSMAAWEGVHVNSDGRVYKLDIQGKDVKCSFPDGVCQLDALEELVLHTNRISGFLPEKIGQLKALRVLDVWDNFLSGPVPSTLAQLTNLRELHLSGNFFSGPIPKELGRLRKLALLYLHGNKLTGTIPAELGQLGKLQRLILINNRLTGPIPVELGQLKAVVEINLANNRLSGCIPAELGQLSNLMKLYLWGNNLGGPIPEELGQLRLLEKLDLAQNQLLMSGGGIPLALRKHRNFRRFVFSVPEDAAPIPPWRSKRSVVPALALGYADLLTDVFTALSYYYGGRARWFAIGLAFIAGPALLIGFYFLRREKISRRVAAIAQVGLLVEACISIRTQTYSHVLVAIRVLEPLLQSLPQVLLQSYVLLVDSDYMSLHLVSLVVSLLSLSFATTGIVAEHPLSQLAWARGVDYPVANLETASACVFATVPYAGSVIVRGGFRVHPQDFVWWFLTYEMLEIVSRVLSLAVVALVAQYSVFVVLAWLWVSRWLLCRHSIGDGEEQETLRFRVLVRLVGMTFMDSVIDRARAYKFSVALTLAETVACLVVGYAVDIDDAVEAAVENRRRVFTVIAMLCMAGKMGMAIAIVVPFKEKIGRALPAEKGELRSHEDEEKPPAALDGGGGGVVSGGRAGNAVRPVSASEPRAPVHAGCVGGQKAGVFGDGPEEMQQPQMQIQQPQMQMQLQLAHQSRQVSVMAPLVEASSSFPQDESEYRGAVREVPEARASAMVAQAGESNGAGVSGKGHAQGEAGGFGADEAMHRPSASGSDCKSRLPQNAGDKGVGDQEADEKRTEEDRGGNNASAVDVEASALLRV